MVINIFYLLGILGLVLIIFGVLIKNRNRKKRDILYIFGGLFLVTYSFYIKDAIFITLQIVFILVAIYDLIKKKKKKK
tara:strand:- start:211 stop:444 length:234 start_codon:yes stop_codon:yes gene_type:complete